MFLGDQHSQFSRHDDCRFEQVTSTERLLKDKQLHLELMTIQHVAIRHAQVFQESVACVTRTHTHTHTHTHQRQRCPSGR